MFDSLDWRLIFDSIALSLFTNIEQWTGRRQCCQVDISNSCVTKRSRRGRVKSEDEAKYKSAADPGSCIMVWLATLSLFHNVNFERIQIPKLVLLKIGPSLPWQFCFGFLVLVLVGVLVATLSTPLHLAASASFSKSSPMQLCWKGSSFWVGIFGSCWSRPRILVDLIYTFALSCVCVFSKCSPMQRCL